MTLFFSCKADKPATDAPVYLTRLTPEVRAIRMQADSIRQTDLGVSMEGYKKMLQKAKELQDEQGLVEAYRLLVFVAGVLMSETDTALHYSDEALVFAHHMGDANTLCDVYSLRAVTYQVAGILDSATVANKEALKYMDLDTAPDSLKNWPLYLNVAGMFNELNDQKLAVEYTYKYLNEYALPNKDTGRMEMAYNNLGLYHIGLRDSLNARKYLFKSYELFKSRTDDSTDPAKVAYNLYMFFREFSGDMDSAAYFIQQYIDRNRELNHSVNIVQGIIGSSEIAVKTQNHQMARQLLSGSPPENLLSDTQVPDKLTWQLFYNYYQMAAMLGYEQQAYGYLQLAYTLGEAHWRESSKKDMQEFELERKKAMQETRVLTQELQLKSKNNTILLLIIVFLAIVSIGCILLLGYRRKMASQKRKVALLEKEKEWEKERSELKGQLDERNRISRELHDDLGASLTSIALAGEILKQKNPSLKADMQTITASANAIVDTLNEIVWSLNSRNDSLHGLVAYIRKFATGFLGRAGIQTTVHDELPPEDIAVNSNIRRAVYLTAKEAINNIVKHSGAKNASFRFLFTETRLSITIQDDGNNGTEPGTQPYQGGGNGLHNMKKNMELVNGSFSYINENGFTVEILSPQLVNGQMNNEI